MSRIKRPIAERFWEKVDIRPGENECWPWLAGLDDHGYGRFGMNGFDPPIWGAHRVSWFLTNGEIPEGIKVLHKCDNPPCVRPVHLFLGTMLDNQRDMALKGRAASGDRHGLHLHPERISRGENRPLSKLTDDLVREIRIRYIPYVTPAKTLGEEYGVSEMCILRLVARKSWKHVS